MDCVNHTGVGATAYCQSCGKALCAGCVRNAAGGQILCEPCWTAWHSYRQPFNAAPPGSPSPSAAALLGLIPGVGAMYNGQFLKGLIHVAIFAVLVSAAHVYGIFGLFIAAWVMYQSFEAYHTARARRDGQPLPDPLGLNELASYFNAGGRGQYPPPPGAGPGPTDAGQGPVGGGYQPPYQTPYQAPYSGAYQAPNQTPNQPPYQSTYQGPYQGSYQGSYQAPNPDPSAPPIPPVPQAMWRRKEPIGAIVLIALGVIFLMGQLDIFSTRIIEFSWPVVLIGLGVWLIVRRVGETQGGSK